MEKKIDEILNNFYLGKIDLIEVRKQLLILYGVLLPKGTLCVCDKRKPFPIENRTDWYCTNCVDVKYLGIPNICFSLADKDDKREIDFIKQRIERGFDDSETWSLRDTMALFILPRLKRYQEIVNGFFKRDDELVNDIDCFIKAMELVSRDNGSCIHTPEEEKQMFEGLEKFPKIFMSLWW